MSNGILLFQTMDSLARAERLIVDEGCESVRVPSPHDVPSGCAIALRFPWSQCEAIKSIFDKGNIQVLEIRQQS